MNTGKSRVVWIKGTASPSDWRAPAPEILRQMIETGLALLTGEKDPASAWSRYYNRKDTVGIKVNCLGGRNMCTHPGLASAAAKSLQSMGLAPHRIIVWDRSSRELNRCGFHLNRRENGKYRCLGTDERSVGYEQDLTVQGSVGSRFSTLITRHCSAMINMPVLKDHGLCGLTSAMKNTFGALHNPNKYHEDRCNPYIADANAVPFVRKKNRLVICDAIHVQYKGGPAYHPQWVEVLGSILLAEDPVAIDSVCAELLNRIRARHGIDPIEKDGGIPTYLETAADPEHGLGRCRSGEIELIEKTVAV